MAPLALAGLLALLAAPPSEAARPVPAVVVLADGHRLELTSRPRWAFGRAAVVTTDGRRLTLRWSDVDHEATRRLAPPPPESRATRTWTNADLAGLRGRVSVVGTGDAVPPLTLAQPPGPATAEEESAWRAEATALQAEIARLEATLRALEARADRWEAFVLATGAYQRAAAHELGEIRRQRVSAEERLAQARSALVSLEEAARKARIPPGWLR